MQHFAQRGESEILVCDKIWKIKNRRFCSSAMRWWIIYGNFAECVHGIHIFTFISLAALYENITNQKFICIINYQNNCMNSLFAKNSNSLIWISLSLQPDSENLWYLKLRPLTLGCKDIEIKKSELVTKTQFLYRKFKWNCVFATITLIFLFLYLYNSNS